VDFAASAAPTSLRWRCKCSWKPKPHHFRLSQALANPVVKKGVCGDFILCGLSPPVSADWSLVHRYTFLTSVSVPQSSVPRKLSRAENTLIRAALTAVRRCAGICTFRYTA
jgi:hypothetical protein